jgi:hypothetical protein
VNDPYPYSKVKEEMGQVWHLKGFPTFSDKRKGDLIFPHPEVMTPIIFEPASVDPESNTSYR